MTSGHDGRREGFGVQDDIVVVVGGARGIGEAISRAFVGRGAKVVIIDREGELAAELADDLRGDGEAEVLPIQADITKDEELEAANERVKDEYGAPTVLVNSAGMMHRAPLEGQPRERWRAVMDVNLNGLFWCCQVFGTEMLREGRGSIVNIASGSGYLPMPLAGAYSASKAGVILLTEQLALEWGPRGVRTNAISPGFVRTAISERVYANEELHQARRVIVPLRRLGTPDEIAEVVLFLASEKASYINGANLPVDGGKRLALNEMVPTWDANGMLLPTARPEDREPSAT